MIAHLHRIAYSLVPLVAIWGGLASPAMAQDPPATADAAQQRSTSATGNNPAPGVAQEQRFDPKEAQPAPDLAIGPDGRTLTHARGHAVGGAPAAKIAATGSFDPVLTTGGGIAAPPEGMNGAPAPSATAATRAATGATRTAMLGAPLARAPPPAEWPHPQPIPDGRARDASGPSSPNILLVARSTSHHDPSGPAPRAIALDVVGQLVAQGDIARVRWEQSSDGGKTWITVRGDAPAKEPLTTTLTQPGDYLLRPQATTKDGRSLTGEPIAIRATKGSA